MSVKTTPENVAEANWGLFRSTINLPAAAAHCGMTQKEMKMTFREFIKYHPPDYATFQTGPEKPVEVLPLVILDETEGGF
jgi:hypothetical protein